MISNISDLWPNATTALRKAVHTFGEGHPAILGIACYRCCSVGLGYALPGSDVDGLTILLDRAVDAAEIMTGLERALASLGSPFVASDAVILDYHEALQELASLGPEYYERYPINEQAGRTVTGDKIRAIMDSREPFAKLIAAVPRASRLCRFFRDSCLYARDVIPQRPLPEFLREYHIAGERDTLELKHPRTRKREIRESLFLQWDSLSPIEKRIVKSLQKQHAVMVSSINPELLALLESLTNRGLMKRLSPHLTWTGRTQVYSQLWTYGDIDGKWGLLRDGGIHSWQSMTEDYDFELAQRLN